jgi:hypothetical protein
LLNRAARYFPIIKILDENKLSSSRSVLEVGSGSIGLGQFRKVVFTGCDIYFPTPPELPFEDRSFDAVLASDVLEHIPPEARIKVVDECLRVCKSIAIFGFPCGPLAWDIDQKLHQSYLAAGEPAPVWLQEHMEHAFPTSDVFAAVTGWSIQEMPNEHLRFHLLMMQLERHHRINRAFCILLESVPWLVRPILNLANRHPAYRKIFVLKKLVEPVAI